MNSSPSLRDSTPINDVTMSIGSLGLAEAEVLHKFAARLRAPGAVDERWDQAEFAIATRPMSGSGGSLALSYGLGSGSVTLVETVGDAVDLSPAERNALAQLKSADLLFHWEDEAVGPADRGAAIPILACVPLESDEGERMRRLVTAMVRDHFDGLVTRARDVGYYREAMALGTGSDGKSLFLLYLELKVPDYATLVQRLMAYPDTPFTTWWQPRFMGLLGTRLADGFLPVIIHRGVVETLTS